MKGMGRAVRDWKKWGKVGEEIRWKECEMDRKGEGRAGKVWKGDRVGGWFNVSASSMFWHQFGPKCAERHDFYCN